MLVRYSTDKKGRPVQKAVIWTKKEHNIPPEKIDPDAVFVVKHLRQAGYESYIVGGAVRDLIVGRTPKDFDIVTDATPSKIKRIFRNSRIIGKRFRLVHVFFGSKIFEVSTFRSTVQGSTGNAFGTMDEDVMRRDFTLNALYYDPIKEQVIDYVGGVEDIRKGIINPVIPLDRIFVEDPVRMLRAVKYSSTTGCVLPRSLKKRIRNSASLLSPVSASRLTEELLKIFNSGHSYDIVSSAIETDLYDYLQPQSTSMMMEDKTFENSYLSSLAELDDFVAANHDARLGDKLYFILKDFVSRSMDDSAFKKGKVTSAQVSEIYKNTWTICRTFVLPMNPQRTELDYAVRKILNEYGLQLKGKKQRKLVLPLVEEE